MEILLLNEDFGDSSLFGIFSLTVGLDNGVDVVDLGAVGLDSVGLDSVGLDSVGLDSVGLDSVGLDSVGLGNVGSIGGLTVLVGELDLSVFGIGLTSIFGNSSFGFSSFFIG